MHHPPAEFILIARFGADRAQFSLRPQLRHPAARQPKWVLPGGTGKINVTIDYEYDAMNRITSTINTDAENTEAAGDSFTYSYDAAGNVEEYVSVIAGQTVTTTYRYNEANELVCAARNNVVWVYEYDGRGAIAQHSRSVTEGATARSSLPSPKADWRAPRRSIPITPLA